jgi:hypothetical protein
LDFNKSCKFFVFSQTIPDVKKKNSSNTAGTVTESEVQGEILSEDDKINNDKPKSSKARQQKSRQIVSAKGQLISKCPFVDFKSTKKPTKCLQGFLP